MKCFSLDKTACSGKNIYLKMSQSAVPTDKMREHGIAEYADTLLTSQKGKVWSEVVNTWFFGLCVKI